MNVWLVVLLVVIGIAGAILIGSKANMHYGMAAIAFAYVIGSWICGIGTGTLVAHFPIRVVFTIIGTSYFYGFAVENGTVGVIADRIIYASRNIPWAITIFLGLAAMSIGMLGATAATSIMLMMPVAYDISKKAKIEPFLPVIITAGFACVGNMMPWSSIGVIYRGLGEAALTPEDAMVGSNGHAWALLVAQVIACGICYFIFKGYKAQKIEIDKPKPISGKQKATLILILVILGLTILPRIIGTVFGSNAPILTWMNTYMDLQFLGILGGLICAVFKLGDDKKAMASIPWGLVMTIAGFSILLGVMIEQGAIEVISDFVSTNCPTSFVTPLFHFIGGAFSFVMTGSTVVQTFTPFIPEIAASTGLNAGALWAAMTLGTNLSGIAPFSMGGSLTLGLCHDEDMRNKLFPQLVVFAIVCTIVFSLLMFVGFINWFC